MKKHWLVKQEPEDYPWHAFAHDGVTAWTGVRNYQARNFLREMRKGDAVLYYHSGKERAVVGVARVEHAAYPDPTATDGDWLAVDLVPVKKLATPVALEKIKSEKTLQQIGLVRQSRLSVMPLTRVEFDTIRSL